MMDWQPIETAPPYAELILWNGLRVFYGWRVIADEVVGWASAREALHPRGQLADPQPTHWMYMPKPPVDSPTE